VVEQLRPHTGRVHDAIDTESVKLGARANPRAHQQLGRLDGARAEHHARGINAAYLLTSPDLHGDDTTALKEHAVDLCVRLNREVVTSTHRRRQPGLSRADAATVDTVHGVWAYPISAWLVRVRARGVTLRETGLEERVLPRRARHLAKDWERTGVAMPVRVWEVTVALEPLKCG
jgi:hypothetical protein